MLENSRNIMQDMVPTALDSKFQTQLCGTLTPKPSMRALAQKTPAFQSGALSNQPKATPRGPAELGQTLKP